MAKPIEKYDTVQEYNQQIAALQKIQKEQGKISKKDKERLDNLILQRKELKTYLKDHQVLSLEFEAQADLAKDLSKTMKGINASEVYLLQTSKLITKYGVQKDKNAQKLAKSLGMVVDSSATIQQNMEEIGTAEFQSLNLSKLIFTLKKQNAKMGDKQVNDQIKYLQGQQDLQERLQKAHDITEETAAQFLKPIKYMQDLVAQLPIVGGVLAKLLPVDVWEEQIKTKIALQLKKAFGIKELSNVADAGREAGDTWNKFQKRMGLSSKEAGKLWKKQKKTAKTQEDIAEDAGESAKGLSKGKLAMIGISTFAAIALAAFAKLVMASVKFANETGLAYKDMIGLGTQLAINAEGVAAITEEFGNINNITTGMAVDMLILNKQYGIAAATQAKILKLQTATSGQTRRQLLAVQMEVSELARAEGVSPAAVFEDMAADSEAFAKFTKDSGKNLMKMAIQAKKVGVQMASILGAMEGSLDLETSINAQFEASLLLGRDINLDKFRQLSLTGNALGAQQEIVRLVGSEAEWNRMMLPQRIALAKAVGLQVSEVSKIVGAQDEVNKVTEKGNKMNWTQFAIVTAIGSVLLGIVGALLAALGQGGQIAKMGMGGLKGAGIGAGIGAVGYAGYSALKSQAPDVSGATMNPGTVANVRRGEMAIHAGETAVNTQDFNMAPMIEELKAMRKDMRVGSTERAEQSRQQINTIRGIGAANA